VVRNVEKERRTLEEGKGISDGRSNKTKEATAHCGVETRFWNMQWIEIPYTRCRCEKQSELVG